MTTTPGGEAPPPSIGSIATHPAAVWRLRADFLLHVDLKAHGMPGRGEQLWARRVGEHRFQICCVPFFSYGITLGDVVDAAPDRWLVTGVVHRRFSLAAFLVFAGSAAVAVSILLVHLRIESRLPQPATGDSTPPASPE